MSARTVTLGLILSTLWPAGITPAQEPASSLQTPKIVSATAAQPTPITAGHTLPLTLHFSPAPDGYHGGTIQCVFERKDSSVSTEVIRVGPRTSEVPCGTNIRDGQRDYDVAVYIDETVLPGEYELTQVTLGKSFQQRIPIETGIRFNVRQIPQVMLHVDAARNAVAGQLFKFRVSLDKLPKSSIPICRPSLFARVVQSGGRNTSYPSPAVKPQRILLEQLTYEMSTSFETDAPTGEWEIDSFVGLEPTGSEPRASDCDGGGIWVGGDTQFRFEVTPGPHFVTPMSVGVIVNPSQKKLLTEEANRLLAEARQVSNKLSEEHLAESRVELLAAIGAARDQLKQTEQQYRKRGVAVDSWPAVEAFFEDIQVGYDKAIEQLTHRRFDLAQSRAPSLVYVSDGKSEMPLAFFQSVLDLSILHNELAFQIAASSGTITFDLEVRSNPQGASVSFRRRGHDFQSMADPTNCVIQNLFLAVYDIRLTLHGYKDKEVPFNAVRDTSNKIEVKLEAKRDTR